MWYNDGVEGEVMEAILERFEAEHPEISVTLDVVPYKAVLESLPIQRAAGEGPDIARVTDLGGLSEYYLDMTTYLSNPDYWRENFGTFLSWLDPDGSAISGFMTQLTVTGPYVNKTLFEQAGIALPGEGATWDDWAAASREVAGALDIPIPMAWDRSGHRVAGPAISMGGHRPSRRGRDTDGISILRRGSGGILRQNAVHPRPSRTGPGRGGVCDGRSAGPACLADLCRRRADDFASGL